MSEILLPAKDLKPVLIGLGKVVSRKSTLPVLQQIRIAREGNNITIQATDLDTWATYRFSEQQGNKVEFYVPFETLNKIVKALKGDALITLHQTKDAAKLVYEVGGSPVEVKLQGLGKDEWPQEPKVIGPDHLLPENFKSALGEALECAGNSSRYVLNGACLDVAGKGGHYVVGTNGSHLFASNSFQFNLKASVLIPTSKFIVWNGFAEDGDWHLITGKIKDAPWLKLTSTHWQLVSKQIDGNYPNWRQCVPVPNSKWTRLTLPQSEIESLLKNIPLLPGNDDLNRPVTLEVTADAVLLKGKAKDAKDWTSIRIAGTKVTGKPVEILLNREYLLKAMRFGLLDVEIEGALSPMLFSATGKTLVVMPVNGRAPQNPQPAKPEVNKPAPSAEPRTEERKTDMPTQTISERGNLKPTQESNPYKEALDKVESVKGQLRVLLSELNDLSSLLKQAEKEKRSSEKDVASVRQTIRSLQGLKI